MNTAAGLLLRHISSLRNGLPGLRIAFGPGLLVAVGYMDPGNWATDIGAGSSYAYSLLWVVLAASLMAMLLQSLAVRLGIATGQDLAQACRSHYSRPASMGLWVLCQIAIIACDMAEIIGTAFALKLLFGVPLLIGICLGAVGTLLILLFEQAGRRRLEAIIITLSSVVAICIFADVVLARPAMGEVMRGLVPGADLLGDQGKLLLAVGIIGATVMPHNLYLHSALVNRGVAAQPRGQPLGVRRARLKWSVTDSCLALSIAFFVNAGILILAAAAFEASGYAVTDLRDAYYLLTPLLGTSVASILFGLALLAAGQNSTVTATMAGSIVAQGFLGFRFNPWIARLVTRGSALIPAVLVTLKAGEGSLTWLLVLSQVVLSLQLPFAVFPLIHFCSRRSIMGPLVAPRWLTAAAQCIGFILAALDVILVGQTVAAPGSWWPG
jgi:manganese transport protein